MALLASTKVLTPFGWRPLRAIRSGTALWGGDGSWYRVVTALQSTTDVVRVVLNDGSSIECAADHLWPVRTRMDAWRGKGYRVLSLHNILAQGLTMGGGWRWWLPPVTPLPYTGSRSLPLDPYLLGVYLGDGSTRSGTPNITNLDPNILAHSAALLPQGVALRPAQGRPHTYNITQGKGVQTPNPVREALRVLNLDRVKSEHKIIPELYLLASPLERLWLLRGLCDTDGSPSKEEGHTFVEYSTSSPRLVYGVRYLIESLGGTARTSDRIPSYTHNGEKKEGLVSYRISVKLPTPLNPFYTPSKRALYVAPTKYPPRRAIAAIEPRGRQRVIELKLERGGRTYVTERCILSHADGDYEAKRYAGAERLQIEGLLPSELLV